MIKITSLSCILTAIFGINTIAHSKLPLERVLPLELAQTLANKTLEACQTKGYQVTVTIVDKGGNIRVQIRNQSAGPHTLESSYKKAFTSNSTGSLTSATAENIAKNATLQGMHYMDHRLLFLAGGVPIKVDNTVIGGIGVGGAPSGMIDESCAQEALNAMTEQLK